MKLFMIRHGQTVTNLGKIYTGHMDAPLTPLGCTQAEELRPVLSQFHFDKVYSSDLSRAVLTQKLALPDVQGIQTPLLREFDVGSLSGLTFQEAAARYGTVRDYHPFGGESSEMVSERIRKFLSMLEAEPQDYVAAFVHGGLIKCMLQIVLEADFTKRNVITDNCTIAVFEYNGDKWQLLAWNYMGKI